MQTLIVVDAQNEFSPQGRRPVPSFAFSYVGKGCLHEWQRLVHVHHRTVDRSRDVGSVPVPPCHHAPVVRGQTRWR